MLKKRHHKPDNPDDKDLGPISAFINNSPAGAHLYELVGEQLIFRGGNASADRILGIEHRDLVGLTIEKAFPNLADTSIPLIYKEIAEKGTTWESEELPYQDERISGYFKVNAFQTYQGHMIAMFTDVTAYKNIELTLKLKNDELLATEEELREKNQKLLQLNELLQEHNNQLKDTLELLHESEEKFKAAFKTIPDLAVITRSGNGRIYEVNDSFVKATGYTWEEVKDKTSSELKLWVEQEARNKFIEDLRTKGNVLNHEGQYRCKNGEIRHGLLSASSFKIKNEDYFISLTRDIEEIHKARIYLKNIEERFLQFAENIDDVFWLAENNELLYINNAVERKFGLEIKNIYLNPLCFRDMIHPEDRHYIKEMIDSLPGHVGNMVEGQFRIILHEHEIKWIWMRLFPVYNNEHEVFRVAGIASDITLQKEIENELRAVTEKARESDKLKSAFLANLSHEIRTPMNGIVGFSGLLHNDNIPAPQRKQYIEIINKCSAQLLHIIDDLVDLSKIEANQMTIIQDECNINLLLADLELFFTQFLKQEGKDAIALLKHRSLPDAKSIIMTDELRLRQVLMNLINNAVKFTKSGQIRFGYHTDGGKNLVFFVEDTGIGISESLSEEIFKPFRQGDVKVSREYNGAGLGLSICRGLVKLMGGRIWLNSVPGEGSKFSFTLPYRTPLANKQIPEINAPQQDTHRWKDKKILVVEDDSINYRYITEILKGKGIKITRAETGSEAVARCKEISPDLVIMDIRLPVMDGLEATRLIRLNGNHVPVIAQTAHAMMDDRKKCLEAGCSDYLAKPLQKEALLRMISLYI